MQLRLWVSTRLCLLPFGKSKQITRLSIKELSCWALLTRRKKDRTPQVAQLLMIKLSWAKQQAQHPLPGPKGRQSNSSTILRRTFLLNRHNYWELTNLPPAAAPSCQPAPGRIFFLFQQAFQMSMFLSDVWLWKDTAQGTNLAFTKLHIQPRKPCATH